MLAYDGHYKILAFDTSEACILASVVEFSRYYISYGGWCIDSLIGSHQESRRHNCNIIDVRPAYKDYPQDPIDTRFSTSKRSNGPVDWKCSDLCHRRLLAGLLQCASSQRVSGSNMKRDQNCLARVVVTGARRRDYVKPVLKELHWLHIRLRISFEIAALIQTTNHHILRTSLTTSNKSGHFASLQRLFWKNRQLELQLVTTVFIILLPRLGTTYRKLHDRDIRFI